LLLLYVVTEGHLALPFLWLCTYVTILWKYVTILCTYVTIYGKVWDLNAEWILGS
jgi:hypothetical protein